MLLLYRFLVAHPKLALNLQARLRAYNFAAFVFAMLTRNFRALTLGHQKDPNLLSAKLEEIKGIHKALVRFTYSITFSCLPPLLLLLSLLSSLSYSSSNATPAHILLL